MTGKQDWINAGKASAGTARESNDYSAAEAAPGKALPARERRQIWQYGMKRLYALLRRISAAY